MAAINCGGEEIIEFIIDNGVDLNAQNGHGVVSLVVALYHASDNSLVRLFSWSGAKLGSRSKPHLKQRLEHCLSGN